MIVVGEKFVIALLTVTVCITIRIKIKFSVYASHFREETTKLLETRDSYGCFIGGQRSYQNRSLFLVVMSAVRAIVF